MGLGFEVGCTLMQLTELAQVAAFALAVEAELLKQIPRITRYGITEVSRPTFAACSDRLIL